MSDDEALSGKEVVEAGWARHQYRQGTKECIAFRNGAVWWRERMAQQPQCAQCKKPYRKGATTAGCPKCAPGVVVSEAEFRQPIAPPGYALVSIDALKVWGKYDEVQAACQYPVAEPRVCPTCDDVGFCIKPSECAPRIATEMVIKHVASDDTEGGAI